MRILLKVSGEQLGGDKRGFDVEVAKYLAEEIRPLMDAGHEVIIMVGGGNFVRGKDIAHELIGKNNADECGMVATVINAKLLGDVFHNLGLPASALSKLSIPAIIDDFTHRRAEHHIRKGRVVIVGGGTSQTGFTTDTGALNLAIQLSCNAVVKLTKVDGVYDSDPTKNPNAVKFDELTYDEALTNPEIAVMDQAALGMAAEKHIPIIVASLDEKGNLLKIANSEKVGTIIH